MSGLGLGCGHWPGPEELDSVGQALREPTAERSVWPASQGMLRRMEEAQPANRANLVNVGRRMAGGYQAGEYRAAITATHGHAAATSRGQENKKSDQTMARPKYLV